MFSRVNAAVISGMAVEMVSVETDVGNGLPAFDMVGLLSSEVREAKERVRTSIKNSGWEMCPKRITVNLSPAGLRKEGGYFDLPIAVGVLLALGQMEDTVNMEETLIVGELSLDGKVNFVRGVLPIVMEGKRRGIKRFIVPKENVREGAIVDGVCIVGAETLAQACEFISGKRQLVSEYVDVKALYEREENSTWNDFADIRGQENVKFAAQIAAAGRHNMLMLGPPGAGKSMIAAAIPSILPKPDFEECMEITKIHSIAGELNGRTLIKERPFRAPHHTITTKALVGGGNSVTPGDITIAHKGVLFLDELTEFKRDTLDALRQPLETHKITISRLHGTYEFPADVMLVAAANPCKCGYYPDRSKCCCSAYEIKKYFGRLSGPMLDRMDICVGVEAVAVEELQDMKKAESSEIIRKRVEAAICIQRERYADTEIQFNSQLGIEEIRKYCYMGEREKNLLKQAFKQFSMSARAYYKTIKVARTIADLAGSVLIKEEHICQALGYRTFQGGIY